MVRTITNGKNPGEFRDDEFILRDNTTPTKKAKFECSGITAATTRTITIPDVNGTLMTTASATVDDSIFRVTGSSDATKKIAFEVDGLTTATTRTITAQDASGTLAYTSDITTTETSFSATLSGPFASFSHTVYLKKIGSIVTLKIPAFSKAWNSVTTFVTGTTITAGYRPTANAYFCTGVEYNGTQVAGGASVHSDGTFYIYRGGTADAYLGFNAGPIGSFEDIILTYVNSN